MLDDCISTADMVHPRADALFVANGVAKALSKK